MSQIFKAPAKESSAKLLIAGLFFLSFIPMAGGAIRLTELSGGVEIRGMRKKVLGSKRQSRCHSATCEYNSDKTSIDKERHPFHEKVDTLIRSFGFFI